MMRKYILAFLAALVLVVGAYYANMSGTRIPAPSRALPNTNGLAFY
jgi:hypothetical protein